MLFLELFQRPSSRTIKFYDLEAVARRFERTIACWLDLDFVNAVFHAVQLEETPRATEAGELNSRKDTVGSDFVKTVQGGLQCKRP